MIQTDLYELETEDSGATVGHNVRRWLVKASSVTDAILKLRTANPGLIVTCAFPSNLTDTLLA